MKEKYISEDHSSGITFGEKIQIDRRVEVDISELTQDELYSKNLQQLSSEIISCCEEERKSYLDVLDSIKKWEECAAKTQKCQKVIDVLSVKIPPNTCNVWKSIRPLDGEEISNGVYCMRYHIGEDKTHGNNMCTFRVTWSFFLNSPFSGKKKTLKTAYRRNFSTRELAEKYINGRKKYYSKYFQELIPEIPSEHIDAFCKHGILLPVYAKKGNEREE